jgi:hypothetical protein
MGNVLKSYVFKITVLVACAANIGCKEVASEPKLGDSDGYDYEVCTMQFIIEPIPFKFHSMLGQLNSNYEFEFTPRIVDPQNPNAGYVRADYVFKGNTCEAVNIGQYVNIQRTDSSILASVYEVFDSVDIKVYEIPDCNDTSSKTLIHQEQMLELTYTLPYSGCQGYVRRYDPVDINIDPASRPFELHFVE